MTYLHILCVFSQFFGCTLDQRTRPWTTWLERLALTGIGDRRKVELLHRFCMILLPRRKRCPDKKLQVRRLREMSPLWELELEVFSMHPVFMITSTWELWCRALRMEPTKHLSLLLECSETIPFNLNQLGGIEDRWTEASRDLVMASRV